MNSRRGPGSPSGEGQPTGVIGDRARGRGFGGRASRIGTALVLVRVVSASLTLLTVACAFGAGVRNGLLILALIFLAVFVWSMGAFRWSTWCADIELSAELAAVDDSLDFEAAVLADLSSIDTDRDPRR